MSVFFSRFFVSLGLLSSLYSCTDVVELDAPTAAPELVLNGEVSESAGVWARLELTAAFFSDAAAPSISGAVVELYEDDSLVARLNESDSLAGYYQHSYRGKVGSTYRLRAQMPGSIPESAQGVWLSDSEPLRSVPGIDSINIRYLDRNSQPPAFFEGDYALLYFQEIGGRRDFIRVRRWLNDSLFPRSFFVLNDRGVDGLYFGRSPIPPIGVYGPFDAPKQAEGDWLKIQFESISESFNNYLTILASQIQVGSPFDSPPALVLGNIRAEEDRERYAFGYFRAIATSRDSVLYNP